MPPRNPDDGGRTLDEADPRLDEWLELLAQQQRRLVVSAFVDRGDEHLPAGVLADVVASAHREDLDTQAVLVDLHHVQLPKLQQAGVVDYDREASLVTYRGDPRLERCLRAIADATAD